MIIVSNNTLEFHKQISIKSDTLKTRRPSTWHSQQFKFFQHTQTTTVQKVALSALISTDTKNLLITLFSHIKITNRSSTFIHIVYLINGLSFTPRFDTRSSVSLFLQTTFQNIQNLRLRTSRYSEIFTNIGK